ncbi:MAG: family N-acetyltransferase [Sphingobacterium sp.]|jgi:ribosomal protein S18 acetylase RimI-like enzyme|nr:family N-acetyltransferase [Sphingobacterium sp.]
MIRKATEHDIDAVEQSYIELMTYEKENGSHSNWLLGVYPTRAVAEKSCADQTLYVLQENDEICASMILNRLQPEEYNKIDWEYLVNDEEALVIHTLCIPPSKSRNGFGKLMVRYAMEKAKHMKCRVIRLDTFAGNEPAAALYKKLGFRYAGTTNILLQGLIPEKQIFFEKEIGGIQ